MSNETGKRIAQLERQNDTLYRKIMAESEGSRLDIGAGKWPLPGSESYDLEQGDAQTMTPRPKQENYTLVWSSHLLEHLQNPMNALGAWWELVKPLGYLWLLLPDFYLHEHAFWPSRNKKHLWGMSLSNIFHPHVYDVFNGIRCFRVCWICRATICDEGYDYTRMYDRSFDQSAGAAQVSIEIILQKPG